MVNLAHSQGIGSSSPRRISQLRHGVRNKEIIEQDERSEVDKIVEDLVYESGKTLRGCSSGYGPKVWSLACEASVFIARGVEFYLIVRGRKGTLRMIFDGDLILLPIMK